MDRETLPRFPTLLGLIEAAAQKQHLANLCDGGVFDVRGQRTSNLATERAVAAGKVTHHTGAGRNQFSGIPEELHAWSIRSFGYAPYWPDDHLRLRFLRQGEHLAPVSRPVLTTVDVDDLLNLNIPDDGEAPALDSMVYVGDAVSWIEDVIQAEAAAYADDHGRDGEPPDPAAAFKARQRLRSLHLALDLVKLIGTRT